MNNLTRNRVLKGGVDNDFLIAIFGNNQIYGASGNDWVLTGSGDDQIFGEVGNDVLLASWGNDLLNGGEGHDWLFGGWGKDTLTGGEGRDFLFGESGDDTLEGGAGDDTVAGGRGEDILIYRLSQHQNNEVDLYLGGSGTDELHLFLTYSESLAYRDQIEAYQSSLQNSFDVQDRNFSFNFGSAHLKVEAIETLEISTTNAIPVANPDAVTTDEATSIEINPLLNDADPDPFETLTITEIDATGTLGSVSLANGQIIYNSNRAFENLAVGETATETFSYTVADLAGATDTAPVIITVTGLNDQPVAENISLQISEDEPFIVADFSVSDVDVTDRHTFTILNQPALGAVQNNNDGTFRFSPDKDFQFLNSGESSEISFTYAAIDDSGAANAASLAGTVTIQVEGSDDDPLELFNRSQTNYQAVLVGSALYDRNKPTTVITHGFTGSVLGGEGKAFQALANAYQNASDSNVILFDWSALSGELDLSIFGGNVISENFAIYENVASQVDEIGNTLASFLATLGTSQPIQLIGHSLGAHVVGNAAETYQQENSAIDILLGLDPAGPLFEPGGSLSSLDQRLDESDAERVVALHTSSIFGYDAGLDRRDDLSAADLDLADLDLYFDWFDLTKPWGTLGFISTPVANHSYAIQVLTEMVSGTDFRQDYVRNGLDFFDRSFASESSTRTVTPGTDESLQFQDLYDPMIVGYDFVTVNFPVA